MKAKLDRAREAKKKAEEKQKAAEDDAAQARQEVEQLRARLTAQAEQDGKRAAIAANEDLLLFRTIFDQVQDQINRLTGVLMKIRARDAETAGKLEKALLALSEKVKEAAGK